MKENKNNEVVKFNFICVLSCLSEVTTENIFQVLFLLFNSNSIY